MTNSSTHMQLTPEQQQAIISRGHDILVSASAGSGKTFVLVQRVLNYLEYQTNNPNRNISIDELLIVTFTEKAAEEMKDRIEKSLRDKLNTNLPTDEKRYYLNQLINLSDSYISTLHSFCKRLVDQHGYLIDLTPNLQLISGEAEGRLIKESVWDNLRNDLYSDEAFQPLIEQFLNENDDKQLKELVFQLDNFAHVNPDVNSWFNDALKHYPKESDERLEGTDLFQHFIKPNLMNELNNLQKEMTNLQNQVPNSSDKYQQKWLDFLDVYSDRILQLSLLIKGNQYTEAVDVFQQPLPRKPAFNNKIKESVFGEEYDQLNRAFAVFKNKYSTSKRPTYLQQMLFSDSETQLYVLTKTKHLIKLLIKAAQLFRQKYQQLKAKRFLIDFNDLEHYALEILSNDDVANYYKSHFQEVMIDEYQDTNPLQEKILTIVGNNKRFMVGDVKQSIYRFRLADPSLFLNKYDDYQILSPEETPNINKGEKIILAENFRSRPEVIDSVNLIFNHIMSKEFGEINYQDPLSQLVSGKYDHHSLDATYQTELLLTLKNKNDTESTITQLENDVKDSDEVDTSSEALNAHQIMKEIKRLMADNYLVKSKDNRPLAYSDIVILVPTRTGNDVIEEVAKQHHIPIQIDQPTNYFKRTEISLILSILQLIDNPLQDIPLVAVLRSPIFNFKEPELTVIRLVDPSGFFFDAISKFSSSSINTELKKLADSSHVDLKQLKENIDQFMSLLNEWRNKSRQLPLAQLIQTIYYQTRLIERMSLMPNGAQRAANLNALPQYAESFEHYGFKGLYQFIQYIQNMQAVEVDLESANLPDVSENAVRVLTIHASKGLEFPIVFLTDTNRRFNMQDANQSVLVTAQKGIGMNFSDFQHLIKYNSLFRILLKEEITNQQKAEEMRKLYVAMTRAEEKLYLVGTMSKDRYKVLNEEDISIENNYLPLEMRKDANNYLDWILPAFIVQGQTIRTSSIDNHSSTSTQDDRINVYDDLLTELDTIDLPLIQSRIDRFKPISYEHLVATKTTAFQSVSEIKQLNIDPDEYDLTPASFIEDQHINYYQTNINNQPKFILSEERSLQNIDPMKLGTLYHDFLRMLVLAIINHNKPLNYKNVFQDVFNQHDLNLYLTKKDEQDLFEYVKNYILEYIINANQVEVEKQFSMVLPAKHIFPSVDNKVDDQVMIHGIIDLFIITSDEIILIDYKTDQVPTELMAQRIKKYTTQLNTYALALESAYNLPVHSKYLAFIRMNLLEKIK